MNAHGSYTIEVTGQIIRVRLFDQWNYETTLHFCNDVKTIACTIYDKPWACLVDLTGWELGTPEMWPLLEETNRWSSRHNQKFEASIHKLSIHGQVMEKSDESFSGVETKVFANESDAVDWLVSVGIPTGENKLIVESVN